MTDEEQIPLIQCSGLVGQKIATSLAKPSTQAFEWDYCSHRRLALCDFTERAKRTDIAYFIVHFFLFNSCALVNKCMASVDLLPRREPTASDAL